MKKSFFSILAACAAVIGCNKEISQVEESIVNSGNKENITIIASIAQTKTTASINGEEAMYSWQNNETISVLEESASSPTAFTVSDVEAGAFSGTKTTGKDLLLAISPASALATASAAEGMSYTITLPGSYDNYVPGTTNAVMVGTPNGEEGGNYLFSFKHAAAVAKIVYENVPVGTSGLAFETDQNINGTFAGLTSASGVTLNIPASGSKETDLFLAEAVSTANQTLEFYIPLPAGTYSSFSVYLFDSEFNEISGTKRSKKNISLALAAADMFVMPTITLKEIVDPFEGEWILSGIKETHAYACGKYTEGNNIQNVKAITIDAANQSIEGEDLDDCKITITKVKSGTYQGYYTIQDSNESDNYWYAAGTSNSNHLKAGALAEDDKYFWSISENEGAHIITAKSTNRNTIKFNTNGTSTIFSCYASDGDQASVTLYPYSWVSSISRTAVTLSFNPATPDEITFGDDFTEPTLSKNPSDAPVTYSVVTNPEGIASIVASTGGLTITGAGTITVTASVSDEVHYKPASAYYTLTVKELISDYSTAGTSNVTLSTTGGNASEATVNSYDALKAGTRDNAGAVKIKVPANTTNLHLHAAGWNGENVTLSITGATANPNSLNLTADSGISGSSTAYSLSEGSDIADYYFNITLSGINEETTLTFTATAGKRFVIWGVNAVEDKRLDPEMTWSNESATASITNSSVSFIAPTLNPGNASSVTYNSTESSVATVESDGTVKILAAGTTMIQAIFAGDATYKPSTKEYTLTVTDERTYSITVTQPTVPGCTISANHDDPQKADTEITLSVTAIADGYKFSKWIVKDADENDVAVTDNKFSMPSSNVTISAEFVVDGGDVEVLNERFDDETTADSNAEFDSSKFSNFSGVTSKAYTSKYGGVKLGSSSAVGYITSKSLDLSKPFTVKINVLKYGSDTGKVQVTVGSTIKEITPTATDTQYSLDFDAATSTSTVKIGTSAKRAYIDNVIIIRHD